MRGLLNNNKIPYRAKYNLFRIVLSQPSPYTLRCCQSKERTVSPLLRSLTQVVSRCFRLTGFSVCKSCFGREAFQAASACNHRLFRPGIYLTDWFGLEVYAKPDGVRVGAHALYRLRWCLNQVWDEKVRRRGHLQGDDGRSMGFPAFVAGCIWRRCCENHFKGELVSKKKRSIGSPDMRCLSGCPLTRSS